MRNKLLFQLLVVVSSASSAFGTVLDVAVGRSSVILTGRSDTLTTPLTLRGAGIVPVSVDRPQERMELPLVLLPEARESTAVSVGGDEHPIDTSASGLARIRIDPRAYAALSPRPETPDRRRPAVLLAAALGTTLLLASQWRRRAGIAVVGVSLAWIVGLSIMVARKPILIHNDNGTVLRSLKTQTVRLPINKETPWLPIVESRRHLTVLDPRLNGDSTHATLELTLPTGASVILRPHPAR